MSKIQELVNQHETHRKEGINLIASENYLSQSVRKTLGSDLAGRYHSEWYGGSKHAREIIEETKKLAQKLFGVKHAIVTSLSGNLCDLAVVFAFTNTDDNIAMVPESKGGYPLDLSLFARKRISLPMNNGRMDAPNAVQTIQENQVNLTVLGASFIVFPFPVRQICSKIKNQSVSVFDGSHVLGLIAGDEFQDPLKEGADVLIGSTHKTLYGPQGGLVLTNSKEKYEKMSAFLEFGAEDSIGLIDNPHVNRIAALGIALEEMLQDNTYAPQVVKNAQTLARSLHEQGVPIKFKNEGFTRSHQILLDIPMEKTRLLCHHLEEIGVFIDIAGRIGTAEVTHIGMNESEMRRIAEIIKQVYTNNYSTKMIRRKVTELSKEFRYE